MTLDNRKVCRNLMNLENFFIELWEFYIKDSHESTLPTGSYYVFTYNKYFKVTFLATGKLSYFTHSRVDSALDELDFEVVF